MLYPCSCFLHCTVVAMASCIHYLSFDLVTGMDRLAAAIAKRFTSQSLMTFTLNSHLFILPQRWQHYKYITYLQMDALLVSQFLPRWQLWLILRQ